MTTLAVMKSRIADEVARSDLTDMIAYAITDAIGYYQSKRLFFNESREITFDTSPDQEWYDKFDDSRIPNLMAINYVILNIDDNVWRLCYAKPEEMEDYNPATGQPSSYTYFQQSFRFYPMPNDTWEVRVGAHYQVAAPTSDAEKYNPWMTDAERLIRARAKLNLVRNVEASGLPPFGPAAISIYSAEEQDAFRELKQRTNKLLSSGKVTPYF